MKMQKLGVFSFIVVTVLCGMLVYASNQAFAAEPPIKIGMIAEMTGSFSDFGFNIVNGAKAYMKEGKLGATIDQFPGQQASMAIQALVDKIKNNKSPAKDVTYINPKPITK